MTYPRRPKPAALLDLHDLAEALFVDVQRAFAVPPVYELALHHVDAIDRSTPEDKALGALALQEVQALRRVAAPGVVVTSIDVVAVATSLHRTVDALVAHPSGRDLSTRLRAARDQVNKAARSTAALAERVDGGIVELG